MICWISRRLWETRTHSSALKVPLSSHSRIARRGSRTTGARYSADACAAARRKHERFQQRIARQPVRAVNARHADFARGVQPLDGGPAIDVRHHSAAGIVRRRDDGDRLRGDVELVTRQAGLVDMGKFRPDLLRGQVPQVEVGRIRRPASSAPCRWRSATMSRGASDPRSSYCSMNSSPSRVVSTAPKPADGFGDQERRRPGIVERRGMELDELHVGDRRAGPVRHRDAVARRDGRIGRVEIDLSQPAGGEHDDRREKRLDLARDRC